MRALISYMSSLIALIMLLAAGGAWSDITTPSLTIATLGADDARLWYADQFPAEPRRVTPQLPPGCAPPLRGATCARTLVAGGLELPVTVYDLIPVRPRSAEDWRPIVERYFRPGDVERALRIIGCESGGDPLAKNPRSTARGLFQHLGSLWGPRAVDAGWPGADIYDPVANVAVAAWLVYEGGGWGHWDASAFCW